MYDLLYKIKILQVKKKSNKALKYAAGVGVAGLGVYALSRAFAWDNDCDDDCGDD